MGGLYSCQETEGIRPGHGLPPVCRAELVVDVRRVALDGIDRDKQLVRNLLVGKSTRQGIQHFGLANSEPIQHVG